MRDITKHVEKAKKEMNDLIHEKIESGMSAEEAIRDPKVINADNKYQELVTLQYHMNSETPEKRYQAMEDFDRYLQQKYYEHSRDIKTNNLSKEMPELPTEEEVSLYERGKKIVEMVEELVATGVCIDILEPIIEPIYQQQIVEPTKEVVTDLSDFGILE